MAALYIVSTPIGNLGDVTRRAVEVLRAADVVLAEDTRRTGILLRHLEIETRLLSAHEHNEAERAVRVVRLLEEGKEVALVSDAGTPLLSDPGGRIVQAAAEAGFPVIPVPGPSALLAALVASGIQAETFTFLGFPPRRGPERAAVLEEVAGSARASVLYESPNRLHRLLLDLAAVAGEERQVCVAREVTKLHEEFFRGDLRGAAERFSGEVLGEVVLVVAGRPADSAVEAAVDAMAAESLAGALFRQGLSASEVARELKRRLGIPRNEAYRLAQAAGREPGDP